MFEFAKQCIENGKIKEVKQIDHMLNKNWITDEEYDELVVLLNM